MASYWKAAVNSDVRLSKVCVTGRGRFPNLADRRWPATSRHSSACAI